MKKIDSRLLLVSCFFLTLNSSSICLGNEATLLSSITQSASSMIESAQSNLTEAANPSSVTNLSDLLMSSVNERTRCASMGLAISKIQSAVSSLDTIALQTDISARLSTLDSSQFKMTKSVLYKKMKFILDGIKSAKSKNCEKVSYDMESAEFAETLLTYKVSLTGVVQDFKLLEQLLGRMQKTK